MSWKVRNVVKRLIYESFRQQRIFILGDGRSGTTWVGELVNYDRRYIECFEPFHGRRKLNLSDNRLYPTPSDVDRSRAKEAISSRMTVTDRNRHRAPIGILVKDISSHLIVDQLAKTNWTSILVVRNPLSVAASKVNFGYWHSPGDLETLANSTPLKNITQLCLEKHVVGDMFLQYVLVWCLLHRRLFATSLPSTLTVCFYENLLRNPDYEFRKLFSEIGEANVYELNREHILKASMKPSKTTAKKETFAISRDSKQDPLSAIDVRQKRSAYEILKRFGLYGLYESKYEPTRKYSNLNLDAFRGNYWPS